MISRFHTNDLFDINGTLNADFTHYLLIDTRENRDYVWGHIPNATSIP
jgi:rhodanese-related sulfurtransferase